MGPIDTIVPLNSAALQASFYDDVLVASFPPVELDERPHLLALLADGTLVARGVVHAGRVAGGVMTMSYGTATLIMYLAIAPGVRGGGLGGALLDDAVHGALDAGADVVLVELEHPGHHAADLAHPEYGDPGARLRFYERHGVRLLVVPYFQPALGPGEPRVPGLLLGALGLSGAGIASRHATGEPAAAVAPPIQEFLEHYLVVCEGSLADDKPVRRLLRSVAGDEVPLVVPEAIDDVPVGMLTSTTLHAPSLPPASDLLG